MTRLLTAAELPAWVGRELGASPWFTVDQACIHAFAALTRDQQWIHVDVERADREAGGAIAHGLLTLSLLPVLAGGIWKLADATSTLNYGFDRVRFTAAVPAGARVRLRETLGALEPRASGLLVMRHCVVEIEGSDQPALVADWLGLFRFDPVRPLVTDGVGR